MGEKVQVSSGVNRGDMSGSQSVKAGLWGQWDLICVLVFGPDRESRATLEAGRLCVSVVGE